MPGLEFFEHRLGALLTCFREVGPFGKVVLEVEEFERSVFVILDELPITIANDGAGGGPEFFGAGIGVVPVALQVGREVPEEGTVWEGIVFEGGKEVEAVEWLGLGCFSSGEGEEGGEEIDLVDGSFVLGSGFDFSGVTNEKGFADAAFVKHSFGTTERLGFGIFSMRAVIGGEDDEGVFGEFEFVEGVEDLADCLVHGVDHGGILWIVVRGVAFLLCEAGSVFCLCLNGSVDGVAGEVDKEGLVGVLLDPAGDVATESLGEVLAFGAIFEIGVFVR